MLFLFIIFIIQRKEPNTAHDLPKKKKKGEDNKGTF